MIFFDTTSAASWRHSSGLARVSRRLLAELGASAKAVRWPGPSGITGPGDWYLTPELFSERERPGFTAFLEGRPGGLAAIYHDAIPIKHPDITWPASVERHPEYMKLLARFDRVWAFSQASRQELLGFWKWQELSRTPPVEVLSPGADWGGVPRRVARPGLSLAPRIVSVGIVEPRKNQGVLLDAFEVLRGEGTKLELHLVGRVNPHFGKPIARRAAELASRWPGLRHHARMDDDALEALVLSSRATALPSIAEGFGLPLLESLWMGVPCACSDIAPFAENAAGGGCAVVSGNSLDGWVSALRRLVADDGHQARLASEASTRVLPTWAATAQALRSALG